VAVYDDLIFGVVREAEVDLETRLSANIVYVNAEIRMNLFSWFREVIEKMAAHSEKKDAVAIFLTTPGAKLRPRSLSRWCGITTNLFTL